jgi:hypothetical protein
VTHRILIPAALALSIGLTVAGCGGDSNPTPATPTPVNATLSAPRLDSPTASAQLDTLRPTLTVQNATSDQPAGARTYEFQISDTTSFTAATTQSVNGFSATVGKTGVAEGAGGKTSFTVESDLQPTTMFYWRARAVQGTVTGPWSDMFQFKSKLVGFNRAGELYDPLIHGETVGTIVGSASFVPGKGLRLNNGQSHVRYLLPATVTSGEFSMDVEGLAANGPGDKAKVFGMQEGQDDFIVNRYRVDIQYRGLAGFPPNAITFRALYGDGDDLDKRYEPDTNTRMRSVYNLNPAATYYWRANWGPEFRVIVKDGGLNATGINGTTIYNIGMASPNGTYSPSSHYAYLGAPVGRSGAESASIGGTIYRNVYLGSRPRPETLGSALR